MTLKDDLLPLIDRLRAIPADLGFRPYQVWVRTTTWTGSRFGVGTKTVTDTRLLVGGKDPKVREVRRKDAVAGTSELVNADYEIGPLTPEFASGGVAESTINPQKGNDPGTVLFLIKGPGMPEEGQLCQRVGDHVDKPLRTVIRVRTVGRKGA